MLTGHSLRIGLIVLGLTLAEVLWPLVLLGGMAIFGMNFQTLLPLFARDTRACLFGDRRSGERMLGDGGLGELRWLEGDRGGLCGGRAEQELPAEGTGRSRLTAALLRRHEGHEGIAVECRARTGLPALAQVAVERDRGSLELPRAQQMRYDGG